MLKLNTYKTFRVKVVSAAILHKASLNLTNNISPFYNFEHWEVLPSMDLWSFIEDFSIMAASTPGYQVVVSNTTFASTGNITQRLYASTNTSHRALSYPSKIFPYSTVPQKNCSNFSFCCWGTDSKVLRPKAKKVRPKNPEASSSPSPSRKCPTRTAPESATGQRYLWTKLLTRWLVSSIYLLGGDQEWAR